MVLPSKIATYFDMDVFRSQSPRNSDVIMADNNAGGVGGNATGGYELTGDPTRVWSITVNRASSLEMKWLAEAWVKSGYGTLPVSGTPPGQTTAIPCTFEGALSRVFSTGGGGSYSVALREYLG